MFIPAYQTIELDTQHLFQPTRSHFQDEDNTEKIDNDTDPVVFCCNECTNFNSHTPN